VTTIQGFCNNLVFATMTSKLTHLIPKFKQKMEGTQMHFEAKCKELVVDCKYKKIPQLWL
jgi:hypothetical protein